MKIKNKSKILDANAKNITCMRNQNIHYINVAARISITVLTYSRQSFPIYILFFQCSYPCSGCPTRITGPKFLKVS